MYDKVKQGNYSSISTKANVSHMKKTKRSQVSTCTAVHKPHSTSHQLVTSHVRYTTLPYEHDAAVLYNHNDRPPFCPPKQFRCAHYISTVLVRRFQPHGKFPNTGLNHDLHLMIQIMIQIVRSTQIPGSYYRICTTQIMYAGRGLNDTHGSWRTRLAGEISTIRLLYNTCNILTAKYTIQMVYVLSLIHI